MRSLERGTLFGIEKGVDQLTPETEAKIVDAVEVLPPEPKSSVKIYYESSNEFADRMKHEIIPPMHLALNYISDNYNKIISSLPQDKTFVIEIGCKVHYTPEVKMKLENRY